jgi:hypothetical protein
MNTDIAGPSNQNAIVPSLPREGSNSRRIQRNVASDPTPKPAKRVMVTKITGAPKTNFDIGTAGNMVFSQRSVIPVIDAIDPTALSHSKMVR